MVRPRDKVIHRNYRCWTVLCLRAAVMLATDEGKNNSEMLSVGQGTGFLRVLVLTKNLKTWGLNCEARAEGGLGILSLIWRKSRISVCAVACRSCRIIEQVTLS